MEFKFDPQKMQHFREDYSVFQPTVTQVNIIYDVASVVGEETGLDLPLIRSILIRSIIDIQQEREIFHYMVEQEIPAFKVNYSNTVLDRFSEKVIGLLEEATEEEIKSLKAIITKVLEYYMTTYAMREPGDPK